MDQKQIEFNIARKKVAYALRNLFIENGFSKDCLTNFELDLRGRSKDQIAMSIHTSVDPDQIDLALKELEPQLSELNLKYENFERTTYNRCSFFYNFKYTKQ